MTTPTVFVCSATGTQGGAVARQLRALGWQVHTTTRDPDSSAAKELSAIGLKVVPGDWDNEAALRESMAGCGMLFLNLFPDLSDLSRELRQAKSIIGIAKDAGVKHVVYSSIFGLKEVAAESGSLIAQAREAKQQIEQEIRSAGFDSWTILRPGYFMANLLAPKVFMYPGAAQTGVFTLGYRPDTVLPMIDHEDIAKFAISSFQDPKKFHEKDIILAGDTHTVEEVLGMVSRATGRSIQGQYLSDEELEEQTKTNPILLAQVVSRDMARLVDMDELKAWGIPMGSFAEFLQREKDAFENTYRDVKKL